MIPLLVLLLQTTALLLLGLFALHLIRRLGPAVQTLVGRATLSGVALLLILAPLPSRIAPVWRIPVRPPAPILGSRKDVAALLAAPSALPTHSASLPRAFVSAPTSAESAHQEGAGKTEGAASSTPTPTRPYPSFPNPSFRKDPATEARGSKAVGLFLPSLLLVLWLAVCQGHLLRLRCTAQAVTDGPTAALLASLTPNPPPLLTHPAVHSPFLAGLRRPAIFLPPTYAADFDADALRAVFTHELAHRDRRDNHWTLAARLLTALLWFQPLLWLLGRRLEQISEDACDEAVLTANCPPRAYAACLLSLAERPPLTRSQRTLTAGVAPFRSSLGRRVQRILTLGVPPMPAITLRLRLSIAAMTLFAALSGACLVSSAPVKQDNKHSFSAKGGPMAVSNTPAPEVKPDEMTIYATGNVRIHGILSSGQRALQAPAVSSSQLGQAQFLAGLTPVQGPGVVVTLTDSKKPIPQKMPAGMTPPNLIHDVDINQVVNELKSGGAEAISINGQRLVATSAVRMAGLTIFINNSLQAPPFVIEAIGDPKALADTLTIPGGEADQLKQYDKAMFSVQQAAALTLPAYTGGNEPRYARPVTEGASQNRQERLNALLEQRAALQANSDRGSQAFLQYERSFDAALRQALPQGSAQAFARARNLEFGIGWNAADLAALKLKEKQHPETRRDPALTAERQSLTARLAQMRDEEAGLFPKDAEAQRHLAQVHALALHHPTKPLRLQLGVVEIELLDNEIQRLR